MRKTLATILATVCLAAGVMAAEDRLYDIKLVGNNTVYSNGTHVATGYGAFSNSVSAYVELDGFRPEGYCSIHAITSGGAGAVSNITYYTSIFGPANEDSHTGVSGYYWNTNSYSAVASNAGSSNLMEQVFIPPTRYLKFVIDPSSSATNQLAVRIIIH